VCRKDLVAMFMESPFYFDMLLIERLELVQEHESRFFTRSRSKSNYLLLRTKYLDKDDAHIVVKIIVGYFPPEAPANRNL
jgi:hypothetical protein